MHVSAQVSVYPLGPVEVAPAVEAVWKVLESSGLSFAPGTMSTVVEGRSEDVFTALRQAFEMVADTGATVMVVTVSNACPRRAPSQE
jgi:uncharacterized protein YqgV (UPF0045/DUF77 family)